MNIAFAALSVFLISLKLGDAIVFSWHQVLYCIAFWWAIPILTFLSKLGFNIFKARKND